MIEDNGNIELAFDAWLKTTIILRIQDFYGSLKTRVIRNSQFFIDDKRQ